MTTYTITVQDRSTAHIIERETAVGNTPRTARTAAEALARQLEGFYPGCIVTIARGR